MDTISHDSEGLEGEEIVMLDTRDTERRGTRHIISLDGDNDDEISWTVDEPQPGPSGLPARDTAPTDNESGPGPSSTAQLVANAEPGPSTTANLTRVLRMAELEQPRLREQEEISMASTSSSKRPRSTPSEDEDDGTFGPGEGEDSSTSRRTRRRLETTIGESSSSVAWKGEVPSDVGMRVDPPPARYPFEHANARPSGSGAGSSSLAGPSQETQATRIDEEEPVTDPPPTQLTPDATASGSGSGSLDSSSLSQSFAEGDGGSSSIVEGISASRPGSSTTAGGSSSTVSSAPDDTNSSSNAPDPANPPPVSPTKPESSTESQPDSLSSYTCPICFYPPTNATLTPCGHICCGECLFAAIKTTLKRNEHLLPPRIGGGFRKSFFIYQFVVSTLMKIQAILHLEATSTSDSGDSEVVPWVITLLWSPEVGPLVEGVVAVGEVVVQEGVEGKWTKKTRVSRGVLFVGHLYLAGTGAVEG
ncbi:hypothetical protein CC1G_08061 [Coprinopsis cinerea okayama7|uniref:Zinc finger C3HC4 RING-type domain-containing protein n=1 Tax=Coprinopsis cinerea (strain Okayama-7 / 130 / ATCC MYA-4618 / FGSC 9003) TaxID=240176 RepID=A8NVL1_COPC7|nr:hypothetical protein CC1G_08061 [Coprinopsis cinerea okayama7\|eukprot:XP_001836676.2 hypothetical protein CC1G_08061 [Coprinopsis cinerea okayama7\